MQSDYFQNNFHQKDFTCKDAGIVGITKMFFKEQVFKKSVQREICEEIYYLLINNNTIIS